MMPSIHYDIAHLLGALVLLLSFALLYQRRLFALIKMFAIQSAALAAAAAFAIYAAIFGVLSAAMETGEVTPLRAIAFGVPFAVLMTIGNFTWVRRRNRRAALSRWSG